jgi:hypothetical protein
MSSDVSRFSPPTEALALQYEHLENRTWANRSIARVLAEINVNNLTDQAMRSRQKTAHRNAMWDRSEPETTKAVFSTLTYVAMPLWNARQQSLPTFTELVQNGTHER